MKYFDRVKQTSVTTGTGSLTLGSTLAGYRAFSDVFVAANRFTYVIEEPVSGQWELGIGQYSGGLLVRESPLYGSAAVPVSFASGTKSCFVVHSAPLSQAEHTRTFGSGNDGDVVITTTVNLTQNADYRNLTIGVGGSLVVNGWRVRVSGVCDLSNAGANAITASGGAGGDGGANGSAGSVSGLVTANTVGRAQGGAVGGAGGVAAGTGGTSVATFTDTNGGDGGLSSGGGGSGSGGAGGGNAVGGGISGFVRFGLEPLLRWNNANSYAVFIRGGAGGSSGGGGGGDGTAGGGGGAGGTGGGVLDLSLAVLKVGAGTSAGAISSTGGAGGTGGTPGAGNRGGGGGGAGAGGGYLHLVIGTLVGTKAGALNCAGGNGGNGGSKTGTGVAGNGGYGGNGGNIHLVNLSSGTFTEVLGSSGSVNTGQIGGGPGFCTGDL